MAISQTAVSCRKIERDRLWKDRSIQFYEYNSVGHLQIYLGKTTYFEMHWTLKGCSFPATRSKGVSSVIVMLDVTISFI